MDSDDHRPTEASPKFRTIERSTRGWAAVVWSVGFSLLAHGCKTRAAVHDPIAPEAPASSGPRTTAAPSTSSSVAAPPPPHGAFEGVFFGTLDEPQVDVHPVGARALISRGGTFWGSVETDGRLVGDTSLAKGLGKPKDPPTISAVAGTWPEPLVAVLGGPWEPDGPGTHHVFARRHGAWSRIDPLPASAGYFVPRAVALDATTFVMFAPAPFHIVDGVKKAGAYPCSGTHPLAVDQLPLGPGGRSKKPTVDASFFPAHLASDESGRPYVVGFDACRPGVFFGSLERDPVALERLPGTETCGERQGFSGLPPRVVEAFPSSDRGMYVLVRPFPAPADATDRESSGAPASPPCKTAVLHRRDASGHWTSRSLAWPTDTVDHASVDPAGGVWLTTAGPKVFRVSGDEPLKELALADSCLHAPVKDDGQDARSSLDPEAPIAKIVASSPGRAWIVTRYDRTTGLCRATDLR